jgi:hypothetical protein
LLASTAAQARAWGYEFTFEAISRLLFLAAIVDPLQDLQHRVTSGTVGASRLFDQEGRRVPETQDDEPKYLPDLANLGFGLGVESTDLDDTLRRLPTLASLGRADVLDARTRLSMALHWLATANASHLRPAERVYHAWVAVEHLVSHGQSAKVEVIPLIANVVTLCVTSARIALIHRQILGALHAMGCRAADNVAVLDEIGQWMGADDRELYMRRRPGAVCARSEIGASHQSITVQDSLRAVYSNRGRLESTATVLDTQESRVAWQARELARMVRTPKDLAQELLVRRVEAASILSSVYSVRNRVVHDADPLGFEEAPGLDDLYQQLRVLIDPVVVQLLRDVQHGPFSPLSHSLARSASRLEELIELGLKVKATSWPSVEMFVGNLAP